jgi:hypothetical protein
LPTSDRPAGIRTGRADVQKVIFIGGAQQVWLPYLTRVHIQEIAPDGV